MAGVRFSAAVLWEGALRDDAKNDCEADQKEAGPAMLKKHIQINLKGKNIIDYLTVSFYFAVS